MNHISPPLSTLEDIIEYDFLVKLHSDYRVYRQYYLNKRYKNTPTPGDSISNKIMQRLGEKILSNITHFFTTPSIIKSLFDPVDWELIEEQKTFEILKQTKTLGLQIDPNSQEFTVLSRLPLFNEYRSSGEVNNMNSLTYLLYELFSEEEFMEIQEGVSPPKIPLELIQLDREIAKIFTHFLSTHKLQIQATTPDKLEQLLTLSCTWLGKYFGNITKKILENLSSYELSTSDAELKLSLKAIKSDCLEFNTLFYRYLDEFKELEFAYDQLDLTALDSSNITKFLNKNRKNIKRVINYLQKISFSNQYLHSSEVQALMNRLNEKLEKLIYSSVQNLDLIHSYKFYSEPSALEMFMLFYKNKNGWDNMLLTISDSWLITLINLSDSQKTEIAQALALNLISQSIPNYKTRPQDVALKLTAQNTINIANFLMSLESSNSINAFKLILPSLIKYILPQTPISTLALDSDSFTLTQLQLLQQLYTQAEKKNNMEPALSVIEKHILAIKVRTAPEKITDKFKI